MTSPTSEPTNRTGQTRGFARSTVWVGSAVLTALLFALSWPKYLDHTYWAESVALEVFYGVVAYAMAVYVMVVFVRAMQDRTTEEA